MKLAVTMLTMVGPRLQFRADTFDGLAGTDQVRKQIQRGAAPEQIVGSWESALNAFRARRRRHLLY